jgi:putative copper resistance protein D
MIASTATITPRATLPTRVLIGAACAVTGLGGLALGVSATAPGMGMAAGPITQIAIPLARFAANTSGMAAVGLSLLVLLLGSGDNRIAAAAHRAATRVAICWALAEVCVLWLQAAEISPRGLGVTGSETLGYAADISSGHALLAAVGTAILYAALARLASHSAAVIGLTPAFPPARRTAERCAAGVCLALALGGLVAVPLTGHATQTSLPLVGAVSIALHVVAAAAWVGGLAAILLLVAAQPASLAVVLPRFSLLAGLCIVTVALSGVLVTVLRLAPTGLVSGLVDSGYGLLVLGKTACLAVLACTGGYIRQRLLPRIAARRPTAVVAWAGVELTIMTVAIALGTALARAPVA